MNDYRHDPAEFANAPAPRGAFLGNAPAGHTDDQKERNCTTWTEKVDARITRLQDELAYERAAKFDLMRRLSTLEAKIDALAAKAARHD